MKNISVKDLCVCAMLTTIVFVMTLTVNIRLPIAANGGLVHLGNVPLVAGAILFGRKKGAVAGAVGMALFDLMSGWALWAPFTFVVRGLMGYTIGAVSGVKQGRSLIFNTLGIIAGSACVIAGYYVTEAVLYGNWVSPALSIPGNLVQLTAGAVIGLPLAVVMQKQKLINLE
ncbi:membrane protein [Clostridia bacterium]|nr:membrane protein [Clostridia bacterium]